MSRLVDAADEKRDAAKEAAAARSLQRILSWNGGGLRILELRVQREGGDRFFIILKGVEVDQPVLAFYSGEGLCDSICALCKKLEEGGVSWREDTYPGKLQKLVAGGF